MNTPDWDFWGNMQSVRVWQAVLLSMNNDPDELDPELSSFDDFFEENKLASKRVRLLSAHATDRQYFSPNTSNADPRMDKVRLSEFAAWASNVIRWDDAPAELL